jgi:hypothetical protein
MKEIEIKYKGLKVKHLITIGNVDSLDNLKNKVQFVSDITGVPKEQLYRLDSQSFNMLYDLIARDLTTAMETKEVKKRIIVEGKEYKLMDINKQSVGWLVDATSIKLNPETIMALCYIEAEAKSYSELNDDGTIKYPLVERESKMLEADLADYIGLNAFFLKRLKTLANYVETMEKIKRLQKKKLGYLLTHGLA